MLQMLVWRRAFIRLTCGMFANREHQQNQKNENEKHQQYEAAARGSGSGDLSHLMLLILLMCLDALLLHGSFERERKIVLQTPTAALLSSGG